MLLVDSSPPDYKSFRFSEHKPYHHVKVVDYDVEQRNHNITFISLLTEKIGVGYSCNRSINIRFLNKQQFDVGLFLAAINMPQAIKIMARVVLAMMQIVHGIRKVPLP